MARVRITKASNSRTHAAIPMGWSADVIYPAEEFDNTHYKLYRYMDEDEDDLYDTLVWPIEDVEIIPDLVPVSLSERKDPALCEDEGCPQFGKPHICVCNTEPVRTAHKGSKQIAKTKIASTGEATDYYKLPKWATELRHLMQYKNMNFDVGNIFKASYRLGEKDGIDHEYDLMKIIFFAQSELERVRREKNGQ